MAKCAAEKKLCLLFIGLAQFFRLSYSYFMAKGVIYGYKSTNFFWFHLLSEILGSIITIYSTVPIKKSQLKTKTPAKISIVNTVINFHFFLFSTESRSNML